MEVITMAMYTWREKERRELRGRLNSVRSYMEVITMAVYTWRENERRELEGRGNSVWR